MEPDPAWSVDARAARGVQVGDRNTQVIYSYHGTWTDGVAPAPLIGIAGEVESPYRGLGWFTERDAPFFFGRESATDEVLQRLARQVHEPGILMVSGVSGAGKSSLLRAGVLPRIRGQGLAGAPQAYAWPRLVLNAGHDPLGELALSIAQVSGSDAASVRRELQADPDSFALLAAQAARTVPESEHRALPGVLLVVDQFEQLFTQCPDESQRRAFFAALHAAATARHTDTVTLVVLVVRWDFEARCGDYERLRDAAEHHYLLTAMTERQLRMAITEPAKQAGSRIDADLADELLREISGRAGDSGSSAAGVLPLLSYALDRAWRLHAGGTVTVADYERSGGLQAAVAESAQRVYDSFTEPQRQAARRIFTRLVISGSDGTDTADRVPRQSLIRDSADSDDVEAVLTAFTDERLLTQGEHTVEISHEVLISTWPLLRDTWLAETRQNRVICSRLRAASAEWDRDSRDPAHLYSGSVLHAASVAAREVAADPSRYPSLDDISTRFLAAGVRVQTRRHRQRRVVTGVLLVLVVALTVATVVVYRSNVATAEQRNKAVAGQLASNSARIATADPFGARVSAVAAEQIASTSDTRHAALVAARNPAMSKSDTEEPIMSVDFSPDGTTLITEPLGGAVEFRNIEKGPPGDPIHRDRAVSEAAYSPDGTTFAALYEDNSIQFWDTATGQPLGAPAANQDEHGSVDSMSFGPDGTTLATAYEDGTIRFWKLGKNGWVGQPLLPHHSGNVWSMAFSPDGTTLVTGHGDGTLQFWDVEDNRVVGTPLTTHRADVARWAAFAPDGGTAVTVSEGTIRFWELENKRPVGEPRMHHTPKVTSVAFDPGNRTLVTGYDDGSIQFWDTATGQPLSEPLPNHDAPVASIVFSHDGATFATGHRDGTIQLWDTATRLPVSQLFMDNTEAVLSMSFSPDNLTLATGHDDGTLQLWDLAGYPPIDEPLARDGQGVAAAAFGPSDGIVATGYYDGSFQLWNLSNSQPIGEPHTQHDEPAQAMAFSPDGTTLAIVYWDGMIHFWKLENNRPVGEPRVHPASSAMAIAYSSDGKTLAVGNDDGSIQLWDVQTGQPIGEPRTLHNDLVHAMEFSPAGDVLAVTYVNGAIEFWELENNRPRPSGELHSYYTANAWAVAFSPDGKILASSHRDSTIRLWDMETYQPLGGPQIRHGRLAHSLSFSPDGTTLAASTKGPRVSAWDVGFTADPAKALCASAPGWFTREPWDSYMPPESGIEYQELCPGR